MDQREEWNHSGGLGYFSSKSCNYCTGLGFELRKELPNHFSIWHVYLPGRDTLVTMIPWKEFPWIDALRVFFMLTRFSLQLTYSLTSLIRTLLEKLTGSQLVKKFPTIYGTRTFINAFKSARHLSLYPVKGSVRLRGLCEWFVTWNVATSC
jgi:hypothetical protein